MSEWSLSYIRPEVAAQLRLLLGGVGVFGCLLFLVLTGALPTRQALKVSLIVCFIAILLILLGFALLVFLFMLMGAGR